MAHWLQTGSKKRLPLLMRTVCEEKVERRRAERRRGQRERERNRGNTGWTRGDGRWNEGVRAKGKSWRWAEEVTETEVKSGRRKKGDNRKKNRISMRETENRAAQKTKQVTVIVTRMLQEEVQYVLVCIQAHMPITQQLPCIAKPTSHFGKHSCWASASLMRHFTTHKIRAR